MSISAPSCLESKYRGEVFVSRVPRNVSPFEADIFIDNASKGALASLNDALRMELRPLGVGVLHIVTGGISTKFYGNSAGQKLPEGSVYSPIRADIEQAVAGHTASTLQTMTPETYARKVVDNVLSSWQTTTYWVGGQTLIGYAGVKFGWDSIRDLVVGYMTGMYALRDKYLAATQGKKA